MCRYISISKESGPITIDVAYKTDSLYRTVVYSTGLFNSLLVFDSINYETLTIDIAVSNIRNNLSLKLI